MSEALELELDALFKLPAAALVEARDALAQRLRKAGEREAAARVKELKRPTPAAWAINQLHFQQPALLERAREGAALARALHARDGVDARELGAALNAQRAALNAAVEAALGCCAAAGLPHGVPQQRKLLATLQGWLAGVGDQAPGRMTHDLEAGGFAAVAAVGTAPPRLPSAAATPLPVAAPAPQPDERAQRELARSERSAQEARELVQQRRAAREDAERALEQARNSAREKERELAALRTQVDEREAALARAQGALHAALAAQTNSEQALALLRAKRKGGPGG